MVRTIGSFQRAGILKVWFQTERVCCGVAERAPTKTAPGHFLTGDFHVFESRQFSEIWHSASELSKQAIITDVATDKYVKINQSINALACQDPHDGSNCSSTSRGSA